MKYFFKYCLYSFLTISIFSNVMAATATHRSINIASGVDSDNDGNDDQIWLQTNSAAIRAPLLKSIPGSYATPFTYSRWIGPDSTGGSSISGNTTYRFKTSFMLPENFSNASINLCAHADNSATVYLNGVQFGQQTRAAIYENFQAPAECLKTTSGFRTGVNEIWIDLYNYGGPAGLNLNAVVNYVSTWEAVVAEFPPEAEIVPNEYLITFHDNVPDVSAYAQRIAKNTNATILDLFDSKNGVKGFSATMHQSAISQIKLEPSVEVIGSDAYLNSHEVITQSFTGLVRNQWGLDRIDQANDMLDERYIYASTGKGMTVYVLDTGINTNHPEFEGRASNGPSFVDSSKDDECSSRSLFHGTSVAGIIGSRTFGVAKEVNLVGLRVMKCTKVVDNKLNVQYKPKTTISSVTKAINWITDNGIPNSVVNMSFGGTMPLCIDCFPDAKAIKKAIALKNIFFVAAAGNHKEDACTQTPANISGVFNVGASSYNEFNAVTDDIWNRPTDEKVGSGRGKCIDLFAPGAGVLSIGENSPQLFDGTSLSAAYVSGVAIRHRQKRSVGDTGLVMKFYATKNALANSDNSPNLLLYSGFLDVPATVTVKLSGPDQSSGGMARITATPSATGNYFYSWSEERCVKGALPCWTNQGPTRSATNYYDVRASYDWAYSNVKVDLVDANGNVVATATKFISSTTR